MKRTDEVNCTTCEYYGGGFAVGVCLLNPRTPINSQGGSGLPAVDLGDVCSHHKLEGVTQDPLSDLKAKLDKKQAGIDAAIKQIEHVASMHKLNSHYIRNNHNLVVAGLNKAIEIIEDHTKEQT